MITNVTLLKTSLRRDRKFSYTRPAKWRVETDNVHEDPFRIAAAPFASPQSTVGWNAVPVQDPERFSFTWGEGGTQFTDTDMWLESFEANPEKDITEDGANRFQHIVDAIFVDFRSMNPSGGQLDSVAKPGVPNSSDPHWSGSFFATEEDILTEINGTAMTNSAEQPIEGVKKQASYHTIILSYFHDTFSEGTRLLAMDASNSGTFWGFAANTVRMARWDHKYFYRGVNGSGKAFVWQEFEFYVRPQGWLYKRPDWGNWELRDGAATRPDQRYAAVASETDDQAASSVSGATVPMTPVKLDGSGRFTTSPASELEFTVHQQYDFTTLPGIPSALPSITP